MSVWVNANQVSRTFDRCRGGIDGSAKGGCHDGVAKTQDSKGPSRIFGAYRLILKIHSRLWENCVATDQHVKKGFFRMDFCIEKGLPRS